MSRVWKALIVFGLTACIGLVVLWALRDSIAIAMMKRENAAKPRPAKMSPPNLDPATRTVLSEYLARHHQSPEDYIVSKFADHDVVFVGELHRIRHDAELIGRLIAPLHEAGVHNLGLEFAGHRDQELIDKLITAETYDEQLARQILFNQSVSWGYQEYADIFRAAWEVNRHAAPGAPTFRVVGLNTTPDFSHVTPEKGPGHPDLQERIWPEGPGDEVMARVVLEQFVDKKHKALIYCGIHHAFTRYIEPAYSRKKSKWVRSSTRRMGQIVRDAVGDRAMTVFLHSPWSGVEGFGTGHVYPADGVIDALMHDIDPQLRRAGFDARGTPFGKLPCTNTYYKHARANFVLEDYCDGYVYQRPFSQYEGVTWIRGFINRRNVGEVRRRNPTPTFRSGRFRFLGAAAIEFRLADKMSGVEQVRCME